MNIYPIQCRLSNCQQNRKHSRGNGGSQPPVSSDKERAANNKSAALDRSGLSSTGLSQARRSCGQIIPTRLFSQAARSLTNERTQEEPKDANAEM